ncbi:MAG: hypothetical protein ACHQUC_00605 [Chlamydiales bacterium]
MQNITNQEAWNMYLDIEHFVHLYNNSQPGYFVKDKKQQVDNALDLLAQAVLLKYPRNEEKDFKAVASQKIGKSKINHLRLNSIDDMLNSQINISVWDKPPISLGTALNISTDNPLNIFGGAQGPALIIFGDTETFRNVKNSLNSWKLYRKISEVVRKCITTLDSTTYANAKGIKIEKALERLHRGIAAIHPPREKSIYTFDELIDESMISRSFDKDTRPFLRYPSFDELLDAQFYTSGKIQLSLRHTLNIGRYNPFNVFGSSWGTLWDKASTLKEVETELKI